MEPKPLFALNGCVAIYDHYNDYTTIEEDSWSLVQSEASRDTSRRVSLLA
jgi:hypothetical protein